MVLILLACLEESCPVYFFKTTDGRCRMCGKPGYRVGWALKPPKNFKPPDDA